MSVEQAISDIQKLTKMHDCVLVGIDGAGGSGKSTLAKQIADALDATLIHSDHFYKTDDRRGGAHQSETVISNKFDWQLLQKKVFNNAKQGSVVRYQPYSWDIEGLLPHIEHVVKKVLIIEGVYALQDLFVDQYQYKIWVDVSQDIRLQRGVARDGEHMRQAWETLWLPQDKRYFETHRPDVRADLIIFNN